MKKPQFAALSMSSAVLAMVTLITVVAVYSQSQDGLSPAVIGTMVATPLDEVSGMVKSRSYPDTYWVVNDSGAQPRLFAINREGKTIIPTFSKFSYYGETPEEGKEQWQGFKVLYTSNVDWEAMSADDNYLYLADTGNNFNNRRNLVIYVLSEIDPMASTQSAAIKTLPVRYPEQTAFPGLRGKRHYDSEALFNADGHLYLVTKHRKLGGSYEAGTNLYRLDTQYTDQVNDLVLIDSHDGVTSATGADLSPDGQRLALVSYTDLWIFDRPATGDQWLSSASRRYPLNTDVLQQVETVIWDDEHTLILSNEQRQLFAIDLSELEQSMPGSPDKSE